jgi:hypothetical protein
LNVFIPLQSGLPVKLREQPDGGLLNVVNFGVGVGHVQKFTESGQFTAQ